MTNAESSFCATPNSVHKLQKILQRIAENDGNIEAEEIWREEDVERKLEAKSAGEFLKSSLQRRVSHFRQHKPSRTITDLPDELLVLILDMAGGAKPSLSGLSWLSLVCKRFRRITISIPSLWARKEISSSMPEHVIDLIVGRSRRLGLCLKIKSPLLPNNAIFEHCERWSEITLDALSPFDLNIFKNLAPSTKLAPLRKLSLKGTPHELRDYLFNDDWRPAALDSLHCYHALPTVFTALNFTSFYFESDTVDINDLVHFLSNTPLLESLSIILFGEMDDTVLDEDALVCLPRLKNFSFNSCGAEPGAVEEVFQAISCPNITNLDINIKAAMHVNDMDTSTCLWAAIEGMENHYVHLLKLDLILNRGEYEKQGLYYYMDEIFTNLPKSIQSFSVTARNLVLDVRDGYSIGNFGKLRSVRFNDCNRLHTNFFEDLAAQFKDAKLLLDVLEIHHCQETFSEEDIQEEVVKVLFRNAGVLRT